MVKIHLFVHMNFNQLDTAFASNISRVQQGSEYRINSYFLFSMIFYSDILG